MASLNKISIIGRVGKEPEIKMTPSGQKVATFSIAVSEKYKDKQGQQQEKTEWINIVIWKRLAEIVESYVKKGSSLYLEGKLVTRSWDDATSGQKRYKTEVVAHSMQMLDTKQSQQGQSQGGQQQGYQQQGQSQEELDSSLPF